MAYKVDFKQIEKTGVESSPVATALAGLRANEARYFWNKYKFEYTVYPASEKLEEIRWFENILQAERDIIFASPILEVATYEDENIYWPEFIYENGMIINVLYEKKTENPKRAVGIKLAEGMEIPIELEDKFKFARQKSKLAGTIRGSYFKVKNSYR